MPKRNLNPHKMRVYDFTGDTKDYENIIDQQWQEVLTGENLRNYYKIKAKRNKLGDIK